jgi:hypothetical protein
MVDKAVSLSKNPDFGRHKKGRQRLAHMPELLQACVNSYFKANEQSIQEQVEGCPAGRSYFSFEPQPETENAIVIIAANKSMDFLI